MHQVVPYVYIIVRKDLSYEQQLVQSCHAVAESSKKYFGDEHPHFVVTGVNDEPALLKAHQKILNNNIRCAIFQESDINDEYTALATEPVFGETRLLFRNYQLLKMEKK